MQARERQYKIIVWIKGRAKPLTGNRTYLTYDAKDVYALVNKELLKHYSADAILRVEITQIEIIKKPDKRR